MHIWFLSQQLPELASDSSSCMAMHGARRTTAHDHTLRFTYTYTCACIM